jgi:hypothetical protein
MRAIRFHSSQLTRILACLFPFSCALNACQISWSRGSLIHYCNFCDDAYVFYVYVWNDCGSSYYAFFRIGLMIGLAKCKHNKWKAYSLLSNLQLSSISITASQLILSYLHLSQIFHHDCLCPH